MPMWSPSICTILKGSFFISSWTSGSLKFFPRRLFIMYGVFFAFERSYNRHSHSLRLTIVSACSPMKRSSPWKDTIDLHSYALPKQPTVSFSSNCRSGQYQFLRGPRRLPFRQPGRSRMHHFQSQFQEQTFHRIQSQKYE